MNISFSVNLIKPMKHQQQSKIYGIAWSSNNKIIAIACENRKVYLFDEKGNYKETFSTKKFSSDKYKIVQILFDPESIRLAVAQTDKIIFIYTLGLIWGDEKKITNKFEQVISPTCMIWSKMNIKEIYFGLSNGEIKLTIIDKNISKTLYNSESPCVSISTSLDGKFIISGHRDSTILIYNIQNSIQHKLCSHSCIPKCLSWGAASSILVAGSDNKVAIYDNEGKILKEFDYYFDNDIKEFACCSINNSGDYVALGNNNSIYVYYYNEINHGWDSLILSIDKYLEISSICWKPDSTELIIGNIINSVDVFKINLNKPIIKDELKANISPDNKKEIDKTEQLKQPSSDIINDIDSYIKKEDYLQAANIVIKSNNYNNSDKSILEKIILGLERLGFYQKSGELLEIMGQYEKALNAYRKEKCFTKMIEIAKKYKIRDIDKIEKEWVEYILSQNYYKEDIAHFIEPGELNKAIEILIKKNQWEKAIYLVNNNININPSFYSIIGKKFEKQGQLDKAEEYYIRGGELMLAFNMYISCSKSLKNEKSNKKWESKIEEYKK